MARSLGKKILCLIMTAGLLCSALVWGVAADKPNVDISMLTRHGFSADELHYEEVDGTYYIYTVDNNEASIINVHTTYRGPGKRILTLPATLGVYWVTTLGDVERTPEIFAYLNYNGEYDEYEYDPGLEYLTKIVIPEGCEYIADYALRNFANLDYEFPTSLKKIYGHPLEGVGTGDGDVFTIPECEYEDFARFFLVAAFYNSCGKVVTPSRNPGLIKDLLDYDGHGLHYAFNEIYIPYNATQEEVLDSFFYFEAAAGYSGEYLPTHNESIIHCAPDCEWLSAFDKYTYESGFTYRDQVVTDVVPATSIAFDNAKVYIAEGDYKDISAKTYPDEALWTACDYVSSNPDVVKVDAYSGRITALSTGTATITATHCERGFTAAYEVVVLADGTDLPPDEPTTEEPTTEEPTTEEPTTEEPTTEEPTTEESTTEEPTTEEPTTEEPTTEESTTEEPTTEEPTTEEPTTEEPTTEEPTTEEPTTEEPTTEEPTTEEPTTEEPTTEEPTTEEPTTEEPTTEEPTTEELTTEEPTTEEPTTEEPTTEEPPTGNDGESFFVRLWNFLVKIVRFVVNTFKAIFGV